MAGPTFSDLESFGLLKELYSDDIKFQEHIQSSLYNFVKHADSGEIEFDGNHFNVPVQFQVNESYAAINDGERLPEADQQKGVFAQYRVKQMYSVLEPTTFAATRGHKDGRPNGKYLDDYLKGTLLSFMSNLDFDLYGNGRGSRATIDAGVTPAATSFPVVSSMMLRPGMKLDWYDSTLTTKRGSIKIDVKSVDRINRTVYIDTTFGSAAVPSGAVAGDRLVVYGALAPSEPVDGRHLMGLQRITDNTLSIGNLSPSNYAAWMSVNINAVGANPSQELLQLEWDSLYQISGVYPNRMVFAPAWKRAYLSQFLNQRRFNSNAFDTGATSLTFSPVKMGQDEKGKKPVEFQMLEDKNADPTIVYIWQHDAFCFASDYSDTPHLADEDGNEFRFRFGYDSLQAFYRFWANCVVYQRNAIGKIYNHATPGGVL